MRQDRIPPITQSDPAFRRDLELRVRDGFPVLAALANGPILLALLRSSLLAEETEQELSRCFTPQGVLRPMTALLGLSRARLLREARSYLPFWQTLPVIRGIARFLRMLFRGREQQKEALLLPPAARTRAEPARGMAAAPVTTTNGRGKSGTVASAARVANAAGGTDAAAERLALQRFQKSIRALLSTFVPPEEKLDTVLAELVEKWNPILEAAPKQDLVRDVNALVQDFVHPIRRDFVARPPDLARITSLAEQLSASRSLAKIGNRDPLVRYIQLYMLRTLQG